MKKTTDTFCNRISRTGGSLAAIACKHFKYQSFWNICTALQSAMSKQFIDYQLLHMALSISLGWSIQGYCYKGITDQANSRIGPILRTPQ